jgi:CRISPR system Cascade subunit CasB
MSSDPRTEAAGEPRPLTRTVGALAHFVEHGASPGDVAELRRLLPEEPGSPAFWRLAGTLLAEELRGGGPALEAREKAWASIVNALALTAGLHTPARPLGAALAAAGYSELRFTRLLRAHGAALAPEVRGAAAFLAAKAEPFDATDLAQLVLSSGGPSEEAVRRGVARTFFRQLTRDEG